LGQKIALTLNNNTISMENFAAGVYTLIIEHTTGISQIRVVKE
jgi:hypothetical protein